MAAETSFLIGGHIDQKEFSPGKTCFSVGSSGSIPNISAPITTAFNGSQPMMQLINRAHKIIDQLENIFMEEAYLVFLPFSAQ